MKHWINSVKYFFIVTRDENRDKTLIKDIQDAVAIRNGIVSVASLHTLEQEERLSIPKRAECILTIGGDGTMIEAAQQLSESTVPFLGLNRGHLGYLCDVDEESVFDAIDILMNGQYEVEERMMLAGKIYQNTKGITKEKELYYIRACYFINKF